MCDMWYVWYMWCVWFVCVCDIWMWYIIYLILYIVYAIYAKCDICDVHKSLQNALNMSNLKPCNRGCNQAALRGYASRTSRTSGSGSEGERPVKETKVWTEQFLKRLPGIGERIERMWSSRSTQVEAEEPVGLAASFWGDHLGALEISQGKPAWTLDRDTSLAWSRACPMTDLEHHGEKTSWIPLNWSFASWQVPLCIR